MKNHDKINNEVRARITEALKADNENAVTEAMIELADCVHNQVMKEARSEIANINADNNVLAQRGQHQLTQEERSYYKAVQENRGFTNLDVTLPITIFDRVFEELEQDHPLLSKINFENTTAVTKWIITKPGAKTAAWGKLTSAIVEELEASFDEVDAIQCKLSAFLPVAKDMLELGPKWLDRYVRLILSESIANALEEAIINGTGKDMPIGMMRNLKGSVVERVYPEKDAVALNDLQPLTLGEKIMAPLTKDGARKVSEVLMIVNPMDYWSKIFGQTTFLNAQGIYMYGVLPIPGDIVQSIHVPKGKMVCGVARDYFCGVGTDANIAFSDEYKFLEDERVYIAKAHANGKPKDNDSFMVFDISAMAVPKLPKAK